MNHCVGFLMLVDRMAEVGGSIGEFGREVKGLLVVSCNDLL